MTTIKFLVTVAAVLGLVFIAAAAGAALYGRDRLWTEAFGPPDLGPVDFAKPTRSGKPNDALACPPGACPFAAPDRTTLRFDVAPADLYAEVRRRLLAMNGAEVAAEDVEDFDLRAIVRSRLWRFPDTVSIRVAPDPAGGSDVWVYSASQIGHYDFGGNGRRISRLLRGLEDKFAVLQQAGGGAAAPATPAAEQ